MPLLTGNPIHRAVRIATVIAFSGAIVFVIGMQACRDTAVTAPVKKAAAAAHIMCEDGTTDCFCEIFGGSACDNARPVHGDSARVWCSPRAVVRGERVVCRIYVGQRRPFNVDVRSATTLEPDLVFSTSGGADTGHVAGDTARWEGAVVARTEVRVLVRMPDSTGVWQLLPTAYDTISIIARTAFQDAIQSSTPDPLRGFGKPVMMADYPGMVSTDSGWAILRGGIGRTWHIFPDVSVARVSTGPNRGIVFARAFQWQNMAPGLGAAAIPAGVYIGAALFAGDPFYILQHGRRGNCSAASMDTLHADVYRHELLHYASAIQLRQNMRLHEVYESRLLVPMTAMTLDSIATIFTTPSTRYGMAMDSSDIGIDGTPATVFAPSITCNMRFP